MLLTNKLSLLPLLLLFFVQGINAQTFEEYKKQRQSELDAMKQQQQEFIDRMQNQFDEYVKQKDQEFADYLRDQWEQMQLMNGEPVPELPKPPDIPKYDKARKPADVGKPVPMIQPEPIEVEKDKTPVKVPIILKSDEETFDKRSMAMDFFGFKLVLNYDSKVKLKMPDAINPAVISGFWEDMSNTNHNGLIQQLESCKTRLNLNDYGYYLLLNTFSKQLYGDSELGSKLMLWALLNRSGYRARLAYAGDRMSLMLPSRSMMYSRSYLTSGGLNYFLMDDVGSQDIFTYEKDYPGADKILDFYITSPLNFEKNLVTKSIGFNYNDQPYSIQIAYNKNLIDFYSEYPQVDVSVYFEAAVSAETKESLLESLRPTVAKMSEPEALGFLLKLVQTAFDYQTDQQQFQKEKFFFPEEILFYPYSDCEDRSIFFAYLVRELLNLKVIGLEYPGHIATAVNLNASVEGDYLEYKNEKYVVADPTFVNAPLGMTMPEFRNKKAKIIELRNLSVTGQRYLSLWEKTENGGGFRGDNLQDITFDEDGNAYLTGFYEESLSVGTVQLSSSEASSGRNFFVLKFDPQGNAVWGRTATSPSSATGFSLTIEDNNNLYIAGSYTGTIDFGENQPPLQCMEGLNDVFLAKYNVAGRLIWARKAGLDTYPQENQLTYMTRFGTDGSNKGTSFFSEDENFDNYGLQIGPMGQLFVIGSFRNTSGFALASMDYVTNETTDFDLLTSLKEESDNLIDQAYEPSIAGLFSVVNHIKYNGIKISGQDAQKALDKYNSDFKNAYPSVYESIGLVSFLLNDDGIILLETVGGKSVTIDKLKISNESKIKINSYSSGDAQIDVLAGIRVGKAFIWFDLNYVRLYHTTGDLLFDYDSDHTQKVLNLKDDLLY
jgi:hypothetical protein